jgi:hypothetical protein
VGEADEHYRRARNETLNVTQHDLERLLIKAKLLQSGAGLSFGPLQTARREHCDVSRKVAVTGIDFAAEVLHESTEAVLDVGYNRVLRRFHERVPGEDAPNYSPVTENAPAGTISDRELALGGRSGRMNSVGA